MVQVVQVVRVARTICLSDMHSENIWFSWSKQSKCGENLIHHACDRGGWADGKWRIEQYSELNQKLQLVSLLISALGPGGENGKDH